MATNANRNRRGDCLTCLARIVRFSYRRRLARHQRSVGDASQEVHVQAEHINPFISSLVTTLSKMLDCNATRGKIALAANGQRYYPISGVIGLSGNAAGAVVINLSEEFALRAASHLLMAEYREIDSDVIDAVGELTNVVAGHAKTQLEEFAMSVSLPNVIVGEEHAINFPTAAPGLSVPFETDFGPLRLEVALEVVAACV